MKSIVVATLLVFWSAVAFAQDGTVTTPGACSGQGKDRHPPDLGLREGRQAVWRAGAAGGGVLLLADRAGKHPQGSSGQLHRGLPG